MAAGLGFKNFASGEVLTAADVNGYLMQGVLVFASTAARDAAITSPQEGQFAYTKDTNGLWYYDGAAWVASGATGDIEGVTAGVGISGGGTSGTVTVTNSMATAIDAKGDLIGGTGADTFARLPVGTDGQALIADSTAATGLKWGSSSPSYTYTSWTPVLKQGATTVAFTDLGSQYVQIGKFAHVTGFLDVNSGASGTSGNPIYINNLPLTAKNRSGAYEPNGVAAVQDYSASTWWNASAYVQGGTSVYFISGINLSAGTRRYGTTGSEFAIGLGSFDQIFFSITYEVA
jgi:hypothetical protein